jgi:TrpR-related protein YerC/YecD
MSEENALLDAFQSLRNRKELRRFLADLCTPGELRALEERWKVARLLDNGRLTYREIAERTGASTTTVVRVARFLNGMPHKGYRLVLDRMKGP